MVEFDFRNQVSMEELKEIENLCIEKDYKLNLGCGSDIREDFVNIDIIPLPGIDIIADVKDLSFIQEGSVNYIVAQHILDYIPRNMMLKALASWRRALKPGSNIEIRVLDLGLVTKAMYLNHISKEMGLFDEMIISLLYGKQINSYDIRLNGFTSEYLQGILTGLGFLIHGVAYEEYDVIISAQRVTEE